MRAFQLVRPDGGIAADGYVVFSQYLVAWRGQRPQYRLWASIDAAIAGHDSQNDGLTVRGL